MAKKVLINVEEADIRIAMLENGELVELFVEEPEEKSIVGNIYKGVVEDVVPGLDAAFIDIGLKRNAFLHFSEYDSRVKVFLEKDPSIWERFFTPQKSSQTQRAPVEPERKIPLSKGEQILVQVTRDEIGDKAPRMTTNISMPGRHLVLLPLEGSRGGISRKIKGRDERRRLRKILSSVRSQGLGFIVRTASTFAEDDEIRQDADFLRKKWETVVHSAKRRKAASLVYNDHDILYRIVRDVFTPNIDEVWIDSKRNHRNLLNAVVQLLPNLRGVVRVYEANDNLFSMWDVEKQIEAALRTRVWLKHGGYVVIDETEALTAIDVNSGRFTSGRNHARTVYRTNLEACEVIAKQIRLRDLGGLIVIDFIDMLSKEQQHKVIQEFKKWIKRDRATKAILGLSEFGLLEMTRKRVRESLKKVLLEECPYCKGTGTVQSYGQIWRKVKYAVTNFREKHPRTKRIRVSLNPHAVSFIRKQLYRSFSQLSRRHRASVELHADGDLHIEDVKVTAASKS